MDIRKIRAELRMGRPIYDLPLRVTFYARVSTDQDEQLNSLENQVQYYTELIRSKKNWTFVPGYIDEGISGTSTKKRDEFNRMIRDAKAGLFDFIITKEISRFSRSTLDSIKYTQELLEHNVGVFFQNDNINTLDTDSEFRLVIMAGVAQDEVRKLSERLKFGFRQAIKNGHVLGNDKLYGYDKKDCVLTINEEEAKIVRIIFDLYANERLGTRSISKRLGEMGYTSREGNDFNTLTIRHMLENPKYKGWYCGNKTQNIDYRTKKKAFLDESEWVMYPDPSIPAIVSEELWDRANALYKERRKESMSHSSGTSYHNRYPYSTKIICEEHGTTFHRQVLQSAAGDKEVWQCKVYRMKGRKACSAPQIRSEELEKILAQIFTEMMKDKDAIIDSLITVLTHVPKEVDYERMLTHVEGEIAATKQKKDRLLDLHIAGAITIEEFKERNDGLNDQLKQQESQLAAVRQEQSKASSQELDIAAIRQELEKQLSFEGEINTALVATILDKVVVKKESTKEEIHLDIYLKLGQKYEAIYSPQVLPAGINPPKTIGLRDNFFMYLLYDSGCRIQEILDLKLKDFVIQKGTAELHIVGKGNKYRVTPISQELIPKFERYCSTYHQSSGYEDFLFYTTRKGVRSQMSCDAAQAFIKKYGEKAKSSDPEIPHLHPHLFRHTRAMHLYMAGMPLELVSQWLGHSQMETSLIYARATTEMKRKAIDKISKAENSVFKEDEKFKYADNETVIRQLYGLM